IARLILAPRHRHPCHAEQEARIDAVVAGLDAFAAKHAGARPFARGVRAVARSMSMMPAMTARGSASTPPGPVTGQTSTHLPQRVQASAIAATRADSAVSNV